MRIVAILLIFFAAPAFAQDKEKIWNHYQALTAHEENSPIKAPKAPDQPQAQAQAQTAPIGLQGILQQYHANKHQQRQMKTLRFNPPQIQSTTQK